MYRAIRNTKTKLEKALGLGDYAIRKYMHRPARQICLQLLNHRRQPHAQQRRFPARQADLGRVRRDERQNLRQFLPAAMNRRLPLAVAST
jgi:hypothetical protein